MLYKKWMAGVILLFIVFGYLLFRFAVETHHIQSIVQELRGTEEAEKKPKAYHVILIEQEQGHPYWQMVEKGAEQAAKQYGIEVECSGPVRNNTEEQLKLLEKAIAAKVDAIIVQGLNEQFLPVIDKAADKGIPVVTIDTDSPASKRISYVGTDNKAAGRQLGRLVADRVEAPGKIGVILGSDTAENMLERLSGLKSVLNRYPGLEIVDVRSSNISMIQAIKQGEDMLRKHPDIEMVVGTSATDALGVLQAKKTLRLEHVRIIAFDNLPETMKAISEGDIEATVAQQPYLMGYQAVRLLNRHFQGEKLPFQLFTPVEVFDSTHVQHVQLGKGD